MDQTPHNKSGNQPFPGTVAELRRQLDYYRDVIESIGDGYFEVDLEGNITQVNEALCQITGYSRKDLIGLNNRDYTTPETARKMYDIFHSIYTTGKSAQVENYEVINVSGAHQLFELSASLILDSANRPVGFRGVVRDVTERHQMEIALQESEARYRHVFNAIPDSLLVVDDRGFCMDANSMAREQFIPKDQDIHTLNFKDCLDSSASKIMNQFMEAVRFRGFFHREITARSAIGETFTADLRGSTIVLEGEPHFLVMFRDITELKERARETRLQNRDLTLLNEINMAVNTGESLDEIIDRIAQGTKEMFSGLGAAIYILDEKKQALVLRNTSILQPFLNRVRPIIDITSPEFVIPLNSRHLYLDVLWSGKSRYFLTAADIHEVLASFAGLAPIKSRLLKRMTGTLLGQIYRILGLREIYTVPLISDGEPLGIMDMGTRTNYTLDDLRRIDRLARQVTTIIRRVQAQEERKVALELAQRADRVKTLFLANMSHEIRTPLNSILGFNEILKNEYESSAPDRLKPIFSMVRNSGERLFRTVHEILDISQIESGTFTLKPESFDLVPILADTILTLEPQALEKGLTLTFDSSLSSLTITADRYCITQAISNLVENAIKYTEEGWIDVKMKRKNGTTQLVVEDSGIGIAEDYLERMFDTFSQESTGTTRRFQGIGLGLSLTKRYLDMNQVSLDVHSIKGKGTRFVLQFPDS
ncbi:MAG: PAS domain S-box protein [FCB group bacterium]|nr:PAS domain S-box protein [FCB group bacterium]